MVALIQLSCPIAILYVGCVEQGRKYLISIVSQVFRSSVLICGPSVDHKAWGFMPNAILQCIGMSRRDESCVRVNVWE